jgi:hypothetical protein
MSRRLLPLCFLASLAACSSSGVSVTRQQAMTADINPHLRMLGTVGEVQTVIKDNPFANDPSGNAVRTAMAATPVFPRLRFISERPAADAYGYRVVVGFGDWPVGGDNYCRNPDLQPRPGAADTTLVTAALCVGTSVVSEAAARTARVAGPGDPRLASLMSAVVQALFSQSDRLRLRGPGLGVGISL